MNKEELIKELDSIQRDIWANINEKLQKRGVKYSIGDAYTGGSSIKDILHPRVRKLLQSQKQDLLEKIPERAWTLWSRNFYSAKRFFESKGNIKTKAKLKAEWLKDFQEDIKNLIKDDT